MNRDRAFRVGVGVARSNARRFLAGGALWAAWWSVPAAVGLLLQRLFDALSGRPVGLNVASLLALLVAVETARLVMFYVAISTWGRWWAGAQTLLRKNVLTAQVTSGGPAAGVPARGAGTSVAVFRDDVEDLLEYTDSWVDFVGTVTFATIALVVMVRVDALLTVVVAAPLVAVFLVNRVLADRIRRVRRADREATARVTGFLGDVFSAVLAVKVAGAEDRAVRRLRSLNAQRRATSVRDKVLTDTLDAFNGSTVDLTIGLVLLLVAGRMGSGDFTVGDLALFASYLAWLSSLPRWAGLVLTRHRHAQVATRRMAALLPGADALQAVRPRPLHLDAGWAPTGSPRAPHPPPATVTLRGFGVRHPGGGGVTGVDLHLPAGSFTVVTGAVGAGKTTLVRGLLGLETAVEGVVEWDGEVIVDLAVHMAPPRCAYVPQVPKLFSASLRDNLTLGRATPPDLLADALRLAAFDEDVAEMPDGLDTVVGPRGVRLSGGQLQRAAAARALVADPALLVLDDLSSALDAVTEARLWSRLLGARANGDRPPTVLVVSHRSGALAHADQVVVLDAGRVAGVGTLAELRSRGLDPVAVGAA